MLRQLWSLIFSPLRAHRGRPAALLALIAALVGQSFIEYTPLFSLQNAQFDRMQRQSPRDRSDAPAVVVAVDEKSLAALGQWPWPRQTLARLVDRIGEAEPLAIGLDMIFPEPDRLSPASLRQLYPTLPTRQLDDPDQRLAATLNRTPSVLGMAATNGLPASARTQLRVTPVLSRGGNTLGAAQNFTGAIASLPVLEAAAQGQALLNAQADPALLDPERGVMRRVPLIANVAGMPVASLGPEMLRIALDAPAVEAQVKDGQIKQVNIGDYSLPTQANGELLLHFGSFQPDRYFSAVDVLENRIPLENFNQRFVLLGFTGTGLQDRVVTPLGEKIPGVDIHAQVLESLLSGEALTRPQWIRLFEAVVLVLLGLLLITAVPRLRPPLAIKLGLASALLLFGLSYAFFHLGRLLFDAAGLFALINPVFIILVGNTLVESDIQRRQAEQDLQASREAAAHVAGELSAARRIQMGLLPDPVRLCTDEPRFQLAACLEPAREVGGDYFDCFMLDEQRLCLAVGDVSGKGLPASLFMAVSKSVANALLRQSTGYLAQALETVDAALSRDNPESLFVTTFVAVLDVNTGVMDYVCAGHDAPWRLLGSNLAGLETSSISGPPLCVCDGFPYNQGQIRLRPGEFLIMNTDGVNEASNGTDWFGSDRLAKTLLEAGQQPQVSAASLVEALRQEVRAFEAGSAPSDDLTVLILQWLGPQAAPVTPA